LVHGNQQSNFAGADLIIYGATPSGITAAIEAANLGHTVILLEPTQHVGGMMSNGLGSTDVYGTYSVGGIAAQFFQGVNSFYNGDPASAGGYRFEPHVAESIFNSMLAEQSNITVKLGVSLGSVSMNGTTIAYVVGNDGVTYQGIEYIDASYTGDLMTAAGVSYTVGRESAAEYKEPGAGVGVLVPPDASSIDPYIVPGDSSSGLIAHVSPDVLGATGSADTGVMAYNYRLCLSSKANNEIPFSAPANYDSSEFEILKRLSQSGTPPSKLSDLLGLSPLPNQKYDVNSSNVLSTDEIGESFGYPDGAPSARQSIETEQIRYERALLYFIANDPSVPSAVQSEAQTLGLCKDEFTDNGGWPHQIYVREARRMLGTYVLTLADLEGKTSISDSIGLGGYPIDSHIVNLVNKNGQVEEEGAVEDYLSGTYLIPYRILTPQASQATNLLVPVAVSASHLAFDSLRVEVTYMIMGQAAGAAASIAISQGSTVQGVPHSALQAQLLKDGQVITIPTPSSLSLSATNIAFGTQSFGSYTNSQPVTLTNTGAATIFFTFITLEGGYGSSYLASNNCGASLAVGASCTVQLRFNPQIGVTPALAVVPASLAIYDNTLHSPQNVRLTGTPLAIPPTISWPSPAAIAYGTTLSATQLDAASTVAGTFVYSPPAGTVLSTGSQTLTATFTPSNTTDYIPATASVILKVTRAFTTTALSVSSTSIIAGQSVTLNATVSDSSPGSTGTPTGTVSFYDNGAPLSATPVALTAGTAAYTTAILTPNASNVITAVYSGDANFTGGKSTASNSTTILVAALDFIMAISGPASGTVIPGQSIIYQVNVTPMYGSYASTVNFTVSGLPSGATATFSPSSIAANGGPQTIIVTILTAPASAAAQSPRRPSSGRRAAPLALALLGLLGLDELRKRRRAVKRFFCLLALLTGGAATTLVSGCGGGSGAQGPQNYAVTITATSGTLQHSIGVTLNVQ
jgi:hypothetical protein